MTSEQIRVISILAQIEILDSLTALIKDEDALTIIAHKKAALRALYEKFLSA